MAVSNCHLYLAFWLAAIHAARVKSSITCRSAILENDIICLIRIEDVVNTLRTHPSIVRVLYCVELCIGG